MLHNEGFFNSEHARFLIIMNCTETKGLNLRNGQTDTTLRRAKKMAYADFFSESVFIFVCLRVSMTLK